MILSQSDRLTTTGYYMLLKGNTSDYRLNSYWGCPYEEYLVFMGLRFRPKQLQVASITLRW